jgi:G3E family GTPase
MNDLQMDLCSEEAVVRAEAGIRAINSSVHILHTKHCAIDWELLLNRRGYKHGAAVELPPIAEVGGTLCATSLHTHIVPFALFQLHRFVYFVPFMFHISS